MPSLDEIIDRMRDFAGADFAFILTRRGRLATQHAPDNMPEQGRMELVATAEKLLGTDGVALRTMPREALVPYGGAAPIDVYIAAREAAVLCVVMATWSDQSSVAQAFERGLAEIDSLIDSELEKRSGRPESRRRRRTIAPPSAAPPPEPQRKAVWGARLPKKTLVGIDEHLPPPPKAPGSRPPAVPKSASSRPPIPKAPKSSRPASGTRGRTQRPPPLRRPTPGRGTMPFVPGVPPPPTPPPPPPTAPEISVQLAPIGRRTMAVIELDAQGPDITLGTADIGRKTLAAIDLASVPSGRSPQSSMPDVRVALATMPEIDTRDLDLPDRQTLPFTEPAPDAKRAFEQQVTAPDVRVKLAELDWDTRSAVLEERKVELEEQARQARREAEAKTRRNSNIEVWHDALSDLVTDDAKTTRRRTRPK